MKHKVIELEQRISGETQNREELKLKEPFILLDKLKNRLWIAKRKRYLKEKLRNTNYQIKIKRNLMKLIVGNYANKFEANNSNSSKVLYYKSKFSV